MITMCVKCAVSDAVSAGDWDEVVRLAEAEKANEGEAEELNEQAAVGPDEAGAVSADEAEVSEDES